MIVDLARGFRDAISELYTLKSERSLPVLVAVATAAGNDLEFIEKARKSTPKHDPVAAAPARGAYLAREKIGELAQLGLV